MNQPDPSQENCPIERLAGITREAPDQPLPEDLCQHLENCQSCRARLDESAAPEIDWKLVREALKEPPFSPRQAGNKEDPGFSLLRLLTPSDDPSIVGKIGPFEITEVIGSGGMGMVLKARDPALERFVAIKILAPHLASSATARKRFAREARAAAAVIHDNVIGIYQVSEHHELPYLVMPYLPDPSLQQRLDSEGKLDLESALSIALQVARGLDAAHSQGLIHRDVKPANVLLAKGTERAIITDFGLARAADDASLTNSGVLAGTPHYMSPEQARAETVDARSDLFSLGSLLFAMIAGHPPVNRELGSETIRAIATEPMPRLSTAVPQVPFWLDRLVARLHQANPQDRPQNARELVHILEQCLLHIRNPQSQPLPICLTTQEGNSMPTSSDKRLFALAALGMFVITLLAPVQLAIVAPQVDHLPLLFTCISFFLTLCFALLSWTEYISRFVVKAMVGLALLVVIVSGGILGVRSYQMGTGEGYSRINGQTEIQILRNEIAQLRDQQAQGNATRFQPSTKEISTSPLDMAKGEMMIPGAMGSGMGAAMLPPNPENTPILPSPISPPPIPPLDSVQSKAGSSGLPAPALNPSEEIGGRDLPPPLPNTDNPKPLATPKHLKTPEVRPSDFPPVTPSPSLIPGSEGTISLSAKKTGDEKTDSGPSIASKKAFFRVQHQTPFQQVNKITSLLKTQGFQLDIVSSDAPGNVLDLLLPKAFKKEEAIALRKLLEPETNLFPNLTVHFIQEHGEKPLVEPLKSKSKDLDPPKPDPEIPPLPETKKSPVNKSGKEDEGGQITKSPSPDPKKEKIDPAPANNKIDPPKP